MRLLIIFARAYPRRTLLTLLAVILAGTTEGLSIGTVVPLLSNVETGAGGALGDALTGFLGVFGLEPTVAVLVGVIVLGLVLKSVLLLIASRQVAITVAHVATDLRLQLIRTLLSTRWEYFLHQPIGIIANAASAEAMRSSMAYRRGMTIISLGVQAFFYVAVMLVLSWKATLAALIASAVVLLLLSRLVTMAQQAGLSQTKQLKALVRRMTDNLQSVKPMKSMGRTDEASELLVEDTQRLNESIQHLVYSKEALRSLQEPLNMGFLVVGLFLALQVWGLPLATVALLVILMSKIMGRLGKVQRQVQQMAASESAYYSLRDQIERAEAAREPELGKETPHLEREIRIDDVQFAYDDHAVFERIALSLPARRFTSIIGPSGQGKTTLVDLVTGLLRPQVGDVLLDGQPLADIDLTAWRRKIGYVPQETILLHEPILMNLTLGDPELTEADAERALRDAGAWEFVQAMPEGVQTSVGERGGKLSGGQRQRIAIARALIHSPELLILDEATSALDPATATEVCDTLRGLRGRLTILAISHQPELVDVADVVYHLENGQAKRVEHERTAS